MGISEKKKRGPNLSEWDLRKSNQYYVLEGRANKHAIKGGGGSDLAQRRTVPITARYKGVGHECYTNYAIGEAPCTVVR